MCITFAIGGIVLLMNVFQFGFWLATGISVGVVFVGWYLVRSLEKFD
jgi:hypothetical protein